MTAAVATPAAPPPALEVYRDDGPIARLLGRPTGPPAAALLLIAALPLVAAMLLKGDGASDGLAAAVIAWAVLAGGLAGGRPASGRFAWAVPPLLRVIEYGGLVWLAALAGGDSPPAAFALLAAIAFRHYDSVYRLRHQGRVAPAWVAAAGGGWDGRLLAGLVLMLVGALPAGFYVAAAGLAALFVTESIRSWTRPDVVVRPTMDDEDEEEEAG